MNGSVLIFCVAQYLYLSFQMTTWENPIHFFLEEEGCSGSQPVFMEREVQIMNPPSSLSHLKEISAAL
jgi:hypothetical protein